MYSCPGCGSQMLFDIPSQGLKCGRCDRTMTVEEADRKEARTAGSSFSVDLLTCPTCGAEIRAMNTSAAAFCSYCGSSVMLEQKTTDYLPPSTLIPFQITRDQCFEKFQGMLKKSFCADHRLKKNITADSFRGIYVPYHVYRAWVKGTATIEGSETKGNDTYYYNTTVELNHSYEGIMHDASREMPDSISEKIIMSKDCRDLFVPFSPAYLSGFYADVSDTDPDTYLPYARSEAIRKGLEDTLPALEDDSLHYSTGKTQEALMKCSGGEYSGETLLPVWFMSMRSGSRVLYAVQNAVTGEMWADIPMDLSRFTLVTAGLAVILFFLFNTFLVLRPEMVMVAAMLLAVFAQFAVNGRLTAIRDKEAAETAAQRGKLSLKSQTARAKRLQRRVRRQASGNIVRYLGAAGIGAASIVFLRILSGVEDFRVYKLAGLVLTVVMIAVVAYGASRKVRLPAGSVASLSAMVAGAVILVADPFHSADLPVYIVTLAIMAGVLWESFDLLRLYNRSCHNPLPQFKSHTGGEDNV